MKITALTFQLTDRLGLKGFCEDLENFINTEQCFISGSLVISLNAPFGAGKTTFLQMWREDLKERRKSDKSLPIPIILNTWEADHCGDPLLAVISELSNVLKENIGTSDSLELIREAAKDVAWFSLGIANSIVASSLGPDALAASEYAEKKRSDRAKDGDPRIDLLASFEQRAAALRKLKQALDRIFGSDGPRALVLVDELDRCRPDYAIQFLETIKHLFEVKQVTFVLAVDKAQLRSSAQALYGAALNFDEYYRKFAHRNVDLPQPTSESLRPLIREYVNQILVDNQFRPAKQTYATQGDTTERNFEELALGLKLTPRQINEMFRIVGHVMMTQKERTGDLSWGFNATAILLAAISVSMPSFYHDIGNRRATFAEISLKICQVFKEKRLREWWMMLVISGSASAEETLQSTQILETLHKLGIFLKVTDEAHLRAQLSDYSQAWGYGAVEQPFAHVYKLIEKLKRFSV